MNAVPRKRARGALVRLVGSVLALAIVFAIVDREVVVRALRDVGFTLWLQALGGFLLLHAFSAAKWRFFLGLCGARLGVFDALRCYGLGLFSNLCLPSLVGGDVLRAGLAMRSTGKKEAVVLGSVVDRLSDVAALAPWLDWAYASAR